MAGIWEPMRKRGSEYADPSTYSRGLAIAMRPAVLLLPLECTVRFSTSSKLEPILDGLGQNGAILRLQGEQGSSLV